MSGRSPASANALERYRSRLRELHREAVGAQVPPELLPEQKLDVRLVIDHENEWLHASSS